MLASEITDDDKATKGNSKPKPMKWACTIECKKLNDDEVHAIIDLKESFDQPVQEVQQALDVCDGDCPNLHFTKRVHKVVVDHESDPSISSDDGECHNVYEKEIGIDRQGHPLVCSNDGGCHSKVRILRDAATHYPLLTKLLRLVYSAVNSHKCVQNIDNALSAGDYHTLMNITDLNDFEAMFSNEVESTYEQCADSADCELVKPGVEMKLLTKHAQLIADLEKESEDDPEHVCCSCECLYQRKSDTSQTL